MQKISVKLRKNSKSEKGITLVALITTVILLALVSVPIALHVRDVSAVRDFTEFKDDLLNLRESISESYQQSVDFSENENDTESYIGPKYEGDLSFLNSVQDGKNVKNPNDDNNYYIVDYNVLNQKLQSKLGIHMEKLNYGYTNKYIDDRTEDVYIINNKSRTIYYVKGYEYNSVTYYRYQESFTKINISQIPQIKVGDIVTYSNEGQYSFNKYYAGQKTDGSELDQNSIQALNNASGSSYAISTWKVFSIDERSGIVELISSTPTQGTITLGNSEVQDGGANGYNNAVKILNDICDAFYSNSAKNIYARSINEDDIIKVLTEESVNSLRDGYTNIVQYGNKFVSNTGNANLATNGAYVVNKNYPNVYEKEIKGVVNEVEVTTGLNKGVQSEYVKGYNTATQSIHPYQTTWLANFVKNSFKVLNNNTSDTYYKLLVSDNLSSYDSYWVATRTVNLKTDECDFNVENIGMGKLGTSTLYTSSGNKYAVSLRLRPIVSMSIDNIENLTANSWRVK